MVLEFKDGILFGVVYDCSCNYFNMKAVMCQNNHISTFPFMPPYLFKRFSDFSHNTFLARQEDKPLKTKISLGDRT